MQAILVTLLKAAGPTLLAALRPALLQIASDIIGLAKARSLPTEWKWAEPAIVAVENDLLRLLGGTTASGNVSAPPA